LLEILIAFSILALSLGILLKIFSSGVNTAAVAEEYTAAVQIAESLMAKTGVEMPLREGETTGSEGDKYYWRIDVSPFMFNPDNNVDEKIAVELFKVRVAVSWGDEDTNNRQFELNTLKLANKPLS